MARGIGNTILPVLGVLSSVALYGCGGASDSNADFVRKELSGQLSFAINMVDLQDTGSPQWCTAGTTGWGTYFGEGDFISDNTRLTRAGGMPLSEADRTATLGYLANTLFKAPYVWTPRGRNLRCFDFDHAAVAAAHAVLRNGVESGNSQWGRYPGEVHEPNWDVFLPIGSVSVDSVTYLNEYKVNLGIEYTCRSYQIVASYHGIVAPLDGRQFQGQTSFCLDPQDNRWHQQQLKWA